MNGFNKVILLGTLGSDPRIFTSKEGKEFAALSLATNRTWRNKEGVIEEKTDWHRVTVWGKAANRCQTHLRKGSKVCVEGYLSSYETSKDGERRFHTAINAEQVDFISWPYPEDHQSKEENH